MALRIVDGKMLWLIKLFLKAGVMKKGQIKINGIGTPQGNHED